MKGDAMVYTYDQFQKYLEDHPEILADAIKDGCNMPSEVALNNTGLVFSEIRKLYQGNFDIYIMNGGEVAIDIGNHGTRIGIFCYYDSRIQYVIVVNGETTSIVRDSIVDMPIDELTRAFDALN